jgi:GNAT superfamily N-acetyltransferase
MPEIEIRPAGPEDAGAILAMIRELALYERAPEAVVASEADLRRDGWGPRPVFEVLLAELAGEAVGYALFFPTWSTWEGRAGLYVEDLYVKEGARRLGCGRQLLAAVAALAVERGCARLELSVLDWNPARGFYERMGMTPLGDWLRCRASGEALASLATVG